MGRVKLIVTVPTTHADVIRQAMGDAGGGKLDGSKYSHCSFSVKGQGRFIPLEGAHPTIGETGRLEVVEEERIEITCENDNLEHVIAAMKRFHPNEEVAYDVFSLWDT